MKNTIKKENNDRPRESDPTKPLKQQSALHDNTEQRKKKGSWGEVSGREEEQKKRDDSKIKKR